MRYQNIGNSYGLKLQGVNSLASIVQEPFIFIWAADRTNSSFDKTKAVFQCSASFLDGISALFHQTRFQNAVVQLSEKTVVFLVDKVEYF